MWPAVAHVLALEAQTCVMRGLDVGLVGRYGSLPPPIYIPCKPSTRVNRIIRVTHGVCKHSRYSEVLLAGARGSYLSLLERVFHVKILCF
jgi:hypothetical protein